VDLDRELLDVFFAESDEQLVTLEQSLLELESSGGAPELIQTIFRTAHTLKGNAACLGLTRMTEAAHVVEDVLDRIRAGQTTVTAELVTLLLQTVDAFRSMAAEAGTSASSEPHEGAQAKLFEKIAALGGGRSVLHGQSSEDEDEDEGAPTSARERPAVALAGADSSGHRAKTLRVNVEKLDRMLDITGEIAIARGRMHQLLKMVGGASGERLLEAYADVERLSLALQDEVRRTRMVPIGALFNQFRRITREVSSNVGKEATLSISGEDVEVDTSVIELLRDPLTHMIRNAIDHGIETPVTREQSGKSRAGTVELVAYHDGGSVVIEVRDDGAGIDSERVASKARSLGMMGDDAPSESELLGFIFAPGFSTSAEITELSGRGVGMDVVRRNVESLRGELSVDTVLGAGTTITIRLPLTLAIIDGLSVSVGSETYVIPLEVVSECIDAPVCEWRDPGPWVLQVRDEALPCLDLGQLLGRVGAPATRRSIVVVAHRGGRAGLVVDALLGQGQAVVKPLAQLFHGVPGISGSTILGTGRVALIIDVPNLLSDLSERQRTGRAADAIAPARPAITRKRKTTCSVG